jgi:tellurite resistance protein TerC
MIWIWAAFILFVLAMLALDLGVFHRKAHIVSMREAPGLVRRVGDAGLGV